MRKNTEREVTGWKLLITETFENYLGAAAKQPGDAVIIVISGSDISQLN